MRRNTLVLFAVLFFWPSLAWAGWANWEYRQQAAERRAALAAAQGEAAMQGMLVPDNGGAPQLNTLLDGKPAPAFTLPDLSGKKVSLANYRGKALLINFWATWCGPCKLETPWLVDLRNKYAAQGFEVLGIDTEGDDAKPGDAAWARTRRRSKSSCSRKRCPIPC